MKSNYKQLGRYIRPVDVRNRDLAVSRLLGVSIAKEFMPSIANTVGTDMSSYKIVRKGQFAYGPVTSRNGDKISVALLREEECIISQAYTAFEIIDTNELDPEYLMLWFSRPEFDRYARYHSHGSVREIFGWDEMCRVELPVPDIAKQKKIIEYFSLLSSRISAIRKLRQTLCNFVDILFRKKYSTGEEWASGTLGDVVTMQRGYDLPKHMIVEGKYPVAASSYTIAHHNEYTCESPCIVMGRSGNIANPRLYLERCWAHNTALFSKIFQNNSNPIWVYYALRNIDYSQFEGKGSAVPTLNRNDLHSCALRIPTKELQNEFGRLAMPCLLMVDKIDKEEKKLSEIRACVLSKILVSNQ